MFQRYGKLRYLLTYQHPEEGPGTDVMEHFTLYKRHRSVGFELLRQFVSALCGSRLLLNLKKSGRVPKSGDLNVDPKILLSS